MGRKFWGGLGLLAAMVAGAGAAGAADLAVKAPVYKAPPVILSDWAGFYLGIHGGYGWGDSTASVPFYGDIASAKPKGGLFGGHAGYNWQFGSVVVGVEGDFDGADIKGTDDASGLGLKTNELASARVRVGYSVLPNLLAYGTAGAGWAHSTGTIDGTDVGGMNQFGWTAGAGLEYKVWGNFSVRAEYLHYDFDKTSVTFPVSASESIDVVRGGVSYKF